MSLHLVKIIGTDFNFTSILGEYSSNEKKMKLKKYLSSKLNSSELEQERSINNSDSGNKFVDFNSTLSNKN